MLLKTVLRRLSLMVIQQMMRIPTKQLLVLKPAT